MSSLSFDPTPPPLHELAAATERAWKTLTLVNEWVRFLDGKVAAILAADAALSGALFGLIKDQLPYLKLSPHKILLLPLGAMAISLGISLFYGLYCITPTLYARKPPLRTMFDVRSEPFESSSPEDKQSVLYFEHIAGSNQSADHYAVRALEVFQSDTLTYRQIAEQIYANSFVARQKSIDVGRAVQWLVWSLLCGVVAAFIRALFAIIHA